MYSLEVISFSIESCKTAVEAGAQRIELCDNPMEGGTTPSAGMIKVARALAPIQLFPIIRPRGGDFLYSDDEFKMMQEDIRLCKELGCDGVVIGLLTKDGKVDIERTAKLVELAYPLGVTFHRAFDRVQNHRSALEEVINCGCERILTSGLYPTVSEGKDVLKELVELAKGRITIMPGSGLRASNLKEIAQYTGAKEFHSSARMDKNSLMSYQNPQMKETLKYAVLDGEEVRKMRTILDLLETKEIE